MTTDEIGARFRRSSGPWLILVVGLLAPTAEIRLALIPNRP